MGRITIDQSHQIMATLATNVDWSSVNFDDLQELVVRRPKEAGAKFTAWLNNGCRFEIKGPGALVIDRSKPFDPAACIGPGWTIDAQDERSLALTTIDFAQVRFEHALVEGENVITGDEKLKRLRAMSEIRLDAAIGWTLYKEPGQPTLRFIYDHFNVSWFEMAGTVLRDSGGDRCFLYLNRGDGGSWSWYYYWLGNDRGRDFVSPLLASST